MGRRGWTVAAGAALGLLAGALTPVVFVAACVWDDRTAWSALAEPVGIIYLVVLTTLGAANGGVGARDGWRSDRRELGPVAWVPLSLLLFPAVMFALDQSDSKSWGAALLVVGILAPFVWVAGRVGQEVGVRGRRSAKSSAARDPAR